MRKGYLKLIAEIQEDKVKNEFKFYQFLTEYRQFALRRTIQY
jgi:hypothetical protein